MTDMWRVHPGGLIHFSHAGLYAEAKCRVLHSRRLRDHLEVIMAEGHADDAGHLRWVASGKVAEIEAWVMQIRGEARS